jgi:hypothetical protein
MLGYRSVYGESWGCLMTTLSDLRTKVRAFLKDDTTQKVDDTEMNDYIADAVMDYSRHFPRNLVATIAAAATIDVPVDALPGHVVDMVEVGSDIWTEVTFGKVRPTTGNYWYWRGDQIAFVVTPASSVILHYRGIYDIPSSDTDTITVPRSDEELLKIYVAAKYHQKVGTVAAKLDRFREKGTRDDNPLVTMYEVLMAEYHDKIAERMRRGTVRMRAIE